MYLSRPPAQETRVDPVGLPEDEFLCGQSVCEKGEICIPGGSSQNGVGDTVELPPAHCSALPGSCDAVPSCDCLDDLCPIGRCTSIENGQLQCLAG